MLQSATFDGSAVSIDNTEFYTKSVSVDCSEFIKEKLTDKTFGERLRKSRLELGLSIPEVADLYNVTKSVISRYECNRYNYSKEYATNKLGISHILFRFYFNSGIISINTYNRIEENLKSLIYSYNIFYYIQNYLSL